MIRNADIKDIDALYQIVQENLVEVNSKDYPKEVIDFMTSHYSRAHLEAWLHNQRFFLVYEEDGHVAGMVMLEQQEVKGLYVAPAHHGKHIGRKLMTHLESLVNNEELKLYASLTAHKFYQTLGYKTLYKVHDNDMGSAYLMIKQID